MIRSFIFSLFFCFFLTSSVLFYDSNSFEVSKKGYCVFYKKLDNNEIYTLIDFLLDIKFLFINIFFLFILSPLSLIFFCFCFIITYLWIVYSSFLIMLFIFLVIFSKVTSAISFLKLNLFSSLKEIEVDNLLFYIKHPFWYFFFYIQKKFFIKFLSNVNFFFKKKSWYEFYLYTNRFFITLVSGFSIKTFEVFPTTVQIILISFKHTKNCRYTKKVSCFFKLLLENMKVHIIKNYFN